jgi:hypothetical protein
LKTTRDRVRSPRPALAVGSVIAATRLAFALHSPRPWQGRRDHGPENGATVHQLVAIFDWETPPQAKVYTDAADRNRMASARGGRAKGMVATRETMRRRERISY